jgi:riboflavin-specific deaminase-like protein
VEPVEASEYRQLLPQPGSTDALRYVDSLEFEHDGSTSERPYTVVNFVSSVDGRATVDGQSRRLSGRADRDLFYALRERADAVLIGTNTLAAEQYKRMLPDPARRRRRARMGRTPEPIAVVITRSDRVPLDIPLFTEPEAQVIVFSPTAPVAARLAATVEHAPLVDLPTALTTLRHEHGVCTLLCEGGPSLFGALLEQQLVDELFITLAPALVGGTGPGIVTEASGPAVDTKPLPEAQTHLQLAGVLERDGTLFLRYRL